ncbi:MAG: YceI family protein [Flavobacteriaceae bacterium]|jgi:polyisoprenoid-binding protein YceI|nr:YceI family protein [Flavobacteriaceae bacterium]
MMKIKTMLFSFVLLLSFKTAMAQEQQLKLNTAESVISYKAKHILHAWEGINKQVKGILVKDEKSTDINKIAILVLVKDFDSNNSGRDAHALEVLEALSFPEVRFYSETIENEEKTIQLTGTFEFHGVKKEKKIPVAWTEKSDKLILKGNFELIPTDFGITLPSFMMVAMEDLLTFDFELTFNK